MFAERVVREPREPHKLAQKWAGRGEIDGRGSVGNQGVIAKSELARGPENVQMGLTLQRHRGPRQKRRPARGIPAQVRRRFHDLTKSLASISCVLLLCLALMSS